MITSIIALLVKLPALMGILEKVANLILKEIEIHQKKALLKQMDQSIDLAQKTKDTSQLEDLFKSGK